MSSSNLQEMTIYFVSHVLIEALNDVYISGIEIEMNSLLKRNIFKMSKRVSNKF